MPEMDQVPGMPAPFSAEYWHMGETTIRLGSVTLRRVMGVNNALMTASDRREDTREPGGPTWASCPDAGLSRIVERELDHRCGQSLLQPVELADLDLAVEIGVSDVEPGQSQVLLQDR